MDKVGKLIAYWKMNESNGAINDSTGNLNNSVITNGNARRFNGTSDYVQFNNPIIPIGAKTIKFKFRSNFKPTSENMIIMDNSNGTGNGTAVVVSTNGLWVTIYNGSIIFNINYSNINNLCNGNWHEILFTWDGTTNVDAVKLYVDNMDTPANKTKTLKLETNTPSFNLRIGRFANRSYNTPSFDIDDIQILNGNNEIIAYWKMDESSGNLIDSSGNGYTGTVTGTTVLTNESMPIIVSDGNDGFCRRFNGRSDRINFTNSVIPLGAKTIEFSFRSSSHVAQSILNNRDGSMNNGTSIILTQQGYIAIRNDKGDGQPRFVLNSGIDYCDGNWHKVVFFWDGTTNADAVKLYVDNMDAPIITTTSIATETTLSSYNLFIGCTPKLVQYFNGDLKDIKIYAGLGIQKTNINDMEIGDYIPCKYKTVGGVGTVGIFSELGTCTDTEIPIAGTNSPDGLFNWIMVGYDLQGRKKLVADRNIQTSISWDNLNNSGLVYGNKLYNYYWANANSTSQLNYYSKISVDPKIVVYNNQVYTCWQETDSNGSYQIRIKRQKLNSSDWEVLAESSSYSLNYSITRSGQTPNMIVYNNELYTCWRESNQIRIKKFDGANWATADNNIGINYDVTKNASMPYCEIYNNELYCCWVENNGNKNQTRIKKLVNNEWITADNDMGLNYDITQLSQNPKMIVYNNELYCFWVEYNGTKYQIRGKKLVNNEWISVDDNIGLNYDITQNATNPHMVVYEDELYISWQEGNKMRVKKYNGVWESADNNSYIQYVSSEIPANQYMIVYKDELYCFWNESNSTAYQIRGKKYIKSLNKWVTADNNTYLNYSYSSGKNAFSPSATIYNDELYLTWYEYNGSYNAIIVKKMLSNFTIPNNDFSIRLLTGGISATDKENEWDKILVESNLNNKIVAGDPNIWGIINIGSWTSSVPTTNNSSRVSRGITTINYYNATTSGTSNSTYGFRPVLLTKQTIIPPEFAGYLLPDTIHRENTKLVGTITSETKIKYKILINNVLYTDYTELEESPIAIDIEIPNSLLGLNQNKITLDIETEFGYKEIKNIYVTVYNNLPTGIISLSNTTTHKDNIQLTGTLTDEDLDKVSYRILINDDIVYDWISFIEDPYIDYTIYANKLEIGNNVVKVEYKDNFNENSLGIWQQVITKTNESPEVNVEVINGLVKATTTDMENDKIRYKVYVNDSQKYPISGFSNFVQTPYLIQYPITRDDIIIGQTNIVTVEVEDEFGATITKNAEFTGEYVGLMFMDEQNNYYSSDIGELLQYLDFGEITLGQTTETKKIFVENKFGFPITDIEIAVTNGLSNIQVELSREETPFIPSNNLLLDDIYNPNEKVYFYIRLATKLSMQSVNGTFKIIAKAKQI